MRSFLHPRRVFTTPASVGTSEYGEADPEQDHLMNPYDVQSFNEHSYIEEYFYDNAEGRNFEPKALSVTGLDSRHSDMVSSENDMPYLEPEQEYTKDAWNTAMSFHDGRDQSVKSLSPQSEIQDCGSVWPL